MASVSELTVSGYIRELQRKLDLNIPTDICMIIIMFYPNTIKFDENTMNLTLHEKEIVTSWFIEVLQLQNASTILTSELLYDYNKDGQTGKDFHKKCDGNINTFSIVETEFNGHIFGCFLSKKLFSPQGVGDYIVDDKAFLCVIRSCFKNKEPELFKIARSDYAYFNAVTGADFGSDDLELILNNGRSVCDHDYSDYGGGLHGNMLCGGEEYNERNRRYSFEIKQMNTFTIRANQ